MQPGSGDPDLPLVNAIAAGDMSALDRLYQRHGVHLLNYLIGRLQNRAQAEEVLQNVMIAVWNGAVRFRGDSLVRTWLFSIARLQALKAIRQSHDHASIDDVTLTAQNNVSATVEQHLRDEALIEAIGELPADQQEALEMVFYRGMTINEAAEQLQINPNTLKSRLHRAKATLRRLLITMENDDV